MLTAAQVADAHRPAIEYDNLDALIDSIELGHADVLPFQALELREFVDALPKSAQTALFDCATPVEFAEKIVGMMPTARQIELGLNWYWAGQKEVFDSVVENTYTLVLSGNGVGKTFLAAIVALWLYYRGYAVITTAPTARQVTELLWAEIRTLRAQAQDVRNLEMPGEWAESACQVKNPRQPKHTLMGYTARVRAGELDATNFKGKHHKRLAVIVDEGIGVARSIFMAINALVLGDPSSRVLVIGNPTDQQSYCYELEHTEGKDGKPVANTIHLNGEDHPNVVLNEIVIPGAVTKDFIDLQYAIAGSRDSAYYRTTVRGLWPGDVKDALIQMSWIEEAKQRAQIADERDAAILAYAETLSPADQQSFLRAKIKRDNRGIALGLDVAGEGDNLTVLTGCQNGRIFYPQLSRPCWHVGRDHTEAVDLIITAMRELKRVLTIWIDDTGLGAAVSADLAKRRRDNPGDFPLIPIFIVKGPLAKPSEYIAQCVVHRINFGGVPPERDEARLAKMRDSLYWDMREALRLKTVMLPPDQEFRAAGFPPKSNLFSQLANPIMWRDRNGVIHVLDKRDSDGPKKLTENLPALSPDLAHSACLAFSGWSVLPERQSAPETIADYFAARVEAAKMRQSVGVIAERKRQAAIRSPYVKRAR